MTTSMIAKVARAICDKEEPDRLGNWQTYIDHARAAIEAMRKPSADMCRMADSLTDLVGPYKEANTAEARQEEFAVAWDVMIDAALNEQVSG